MTEIIELTILEETTVIEIIEGDEVNVEVIEEIVDLEIVEGGGIAWDWVIGELAVGEVNGSNCDFFTSSAYVPGSLQVLLNGVLQGTGDFQEILPSAGSFLLSDAPISDEQQTDEIKCIYRV